MTQPTIIAYPEIQKYEYKLLALADHIETVPKELFTMHTFRRNGDNTLRGCGTVGCILGHAPSLLTRRFHINPSKFLYYGSRKEINWDMVSELFGVSAYVTGDNRGLGNRSGLWVYLFAGNWLNSDNTPTGAAARIRWVVKHGGVPHNWHSQSHGYTDTLSYVVDPPGTSVEVWKYLKQQRQGTKQNVEETQS